MVLSTNPVMFYKYNTRKLIFYYKLICYLIQTDRYYCKLFLDLSQKLFCKKIIFLRRETGVIKIYQDKNITPVYVFYSSVVPPWKTASYKPPQT